MGFRHPIIKDLIWLIQNPGLLAPDDRVIPDQAWFEEHLQVIYPLLEKLDKEPTLLKPFENDIKPVVGDYFEKLVALWLEQNPNIQHIKQHQVVFEEKRTVGEFDFLFEDKTLQKSFHWEVAVKYYLQVYNNHKYEFLGPNAKDSFAKKTAKMLGKQLLLSQNGNAKEILKEYSKPIYPVGILKGMLFYPSSSDWKNPNNLPPEIPKNHLKGWWCHSNSLLIPQNDQTSRWYVLKKPFWLTIHSKNLDNPHKINDLKIVIKNHFDQSTQPLLLAEVMQNNTGEWFEVSRGFIVSEHWPRAK